LNTYSRQKVQAAERAQTRLKQEIDESILETLRIDEERFRGCEIRPHEIEEISTDLNLAYDKVLHRALQRGMQLVDKRVPWHWQWPSKVSADIDAQIRAAVQDGVVPFERWAAIEVDHNVTMFTHAFVSSAIRSSARHGDTVDDDWGPSTARKRRCLGMNAASGAV
jgi:hypothetical protein